MKKCYSLCNTFENCDFFPTFYHLSHENQSPNILELPNTQFSLTSSKPQLNQNIKHSVTNMIHNTLTIPLPSEKK